MQNTEDNIGFCAVFISSTEGYTRWPIKECWREVGEHTLQAVTAEVSLQMHQTGLSDQALQDKIIQEWMIELVVEAAEDMDTKLIPCRSYALMQHLGHPCFTIDSKTQTLRMMETSCWREADETIDAQEAEDGGQFFHLSGRGSDMRIMLPFDPDNPSIAPDTFRGVLAPLQQQFERMFGHSARRAS